MTDEIIIKASTNHINTDGMLSLKYLLQCNGSCLGQFGLAFMLVLQLQEAAKATIYQHLTDDLQ